MKSMPDVISTLEDIIQYPSKSTNASSYIKEVAASAAAVLDELVLYMLTMSTKQDQYEEYFVQYVTRHFGNYGITPKSLEALRLTLSLSRSLALSDDSQ